MQPLLSIVVPVYNTQEYLSECLDSIIKQTYKNIEIIIVNDCSPDNSESIILDYQQKDSRIKYIKHETNKGSFESRYNGDIIAQGEYILHVDSDDTIYSQLCEHIANLATQNPDCIVYKIDTLRLNQITKEKEIFVEFCYNKNLQNFTQDQFFKALTKSDIWHGGFYQKVYKRETLLKVYKELNVQERLIMAEDVLINVCAAYYCSNVLFLDYIGYTYNEAVSSSSTKGEYSLERSLSHLEDLKKVVYYLKQFFTQYNLDHSLLYEIQQDLLSYFIILSNIDVFSTSSRIISKIEDTFDLQAILTYISRSNSCQQQTNKWYQFGLLSRKNKIKFIVKKVLIKLHLFTILKKIINIAKKLPYK